MTRLNKPTIKDVAKEAGVSIATVSRVLNNGIGYSIKTKQHVLKTIEEMGYSPNAIARGLINKQSNTIGVLFPEISGLVSAEILQGIEEAAHARGKSIVICNTASSGHKTKEYLKLLQEKQVDGILFASQLLTLEYVAIVRKMGVPVVTVSAYSEDPTIPAVQVDNETAAYDAVCYFIQQGHTEIGMISGNPSDLLAGAPRMAGYKRALKEAGIAYVPTKVAWDKGFYFEDGQKAFQRLYTDHPNLTAIFSASDELAIGAMSAATAKGLRIPEDLSVIGFDGTKLAKMAVPPLTTVSQHFFSMGKTAANLLFDSIATGRASSGRIIRHELIKRHSVQMPSSTKTMD
ncbi:LacI family DNA-binding transcriptional regulator [Bacillus sp. FSL W8-1122]